jgi:GTP diphosphokinase / guanosine-3',5'-bis(diphosphate) 3'-diphosphatase
MSDREHANLPAMDLPLVLRALAFATEKHRGQARKNAEGTPYIEHPIALASLLWTEAHVRDAHVLAAAILHDTIEDTPTTHDELEERFGCHVADIVAEVTDDKRLPKAARKAAQIQNAEHLSYEARLVKLADKTCNLRDVANTPPVGWNLERRREYFEWAKSVVDRIRDPDRHLAAIFESAYRAKP